MPAVIKQVIPPMLNLLEHFLKQRFVITNWKKRILTATHKQNVLFKLRKRFVKKLPDIFGMCNDCLCVSIYNSLPICTVHDFVEKLHVSVLL